MILSETLFFAADNREIKKHKTLNNHLVKIKNSMSSLSLFPFFFFWVLCSSVRFFSPFLYFSSSELKSRVLTTSALCFFLSRNEKGRQKVFFLMDNLCHSLSNKSFHWFLFPSLALSLSFLSSSFAVNALEVRCDLIKMKCFPDCLDRKTSLLTWNAYESFQCLWCVFGLSSFSIFLYLH